MNWQHPPEKLSLPENVVHIWRKRLDVVYKQRERLYQLLDINERKRANRYLFDEPRNRFIVARGVLRQLISQYTNYPPTEITFHKNDWGKPILNPDLGINLEFNIAHSHSLALLGFSRSRPIGVDLEFMHPVDNVNHLVSSFFSEAEQIMFKNMPVSKQLQSFFVGWTRKEAYMKGRGKGLSIPLNSFDVNMQPDEPAMLIAERSDPSALEQWTLIDIDAGEGYAAALAVAERRDNCVLHFYDFDMVVLSDKE